MLKFDLTTQMGCSKAANFFGLKDLANFWLSCNPLYNLGVKLIDRLFPDPKETGKTIEDIIKKGKEEGVAEMEIICSDGCGFDFHAPIEGVDIKTKLGKDHTIKMKVKYK